MLPSPMPSGRSPAPSGEAEPADSSKRWFCLSTNYGQHTLAERALAPNWPVFFPLHLNRRNRQIEPLFPGYAFCQFDPGADDWPRICRTRGVYAILGTRGPQPLPIGVVENLQARSSARRVVDDPGERPNARTIAIGAAGSVLDGPLAGWSGIVTRSRRARLTLLLSLFGRQVTAELHPHQVEAV